MSPSKAPIDELLEFVKKGSLAFISAINRMIRAMVDKRFSLKGAKDNLTWVFGQTLTMADLFGRRRTLLEMDAEVDPAARVESELPVDYDIREDIVANFPDPQFQVGGQVPRVEFTEAIEDIVTREPRLADTWEEVAKLYSEDHAFALTRSTSEVLTEKVKETIAKLIKDGTTEADAVAVIAELGGWSEAYATTVYRTNLNTAYSAGRIRQGFVPSVLAAMPAWELVTARDADVRSGRVQDGPKNGVKENHRAGHGFIAGKRDPIWDKAMPPQGWACRCQTRSVDREELERRGLMNEDGSVKQFHPPNWSSFQPHPLFMQGRPDLKFYRELV